MEAYTDNELVASSKLVNNLKNLTESIEITEDTEGEEFSLPIYPFPEEPPEIDKPTPTRLRNDFGGGTPTASTSATGDNNTDALLSGVEWLSNDITYAFTDNFANDYEADYGNSENDPNVYSTHEASYEPLNTAQEDTARMWYSMYENISDLQMTELMGESDRDATMRFGLSEDPATAYAYYPNNFYPEGGDSWYNLNNYNTPEMGNYAFSTFGHEIGHAFGLRHGHETGGVSNTAMNSDRDSSEFSIMTYSSYVGHDREALPYRTNESVGLPQSPMMYDIAAIQHMYGADFDTNSGDTEYTFSTDTGEMSIDGVGQGTPAGNRVFRTLWDGNGTDTYNFSNYATDLSISLEPGSWSDLDVNGDNQKAKLNAGHDGTGYYNPDSVVYARGHVFNALQYDGDTRSLIENATGGSGNDSIAGNETDNLLQGAVGNDTISGKTGNDDLMGGYGNDLLSGDVGNDTLDGGHNNDTLNGGSGEDDLSGGSGNDILMGLADNDILMGDAGKDNLNGGSGNDYLEGGAGTDKLKGAGNHDAIYGGSDRDIMFGGGGRDTLNGESGVDVVRGEGGPDILYGGAERDILFGGADRDIFVLSTTSNTQDSDVFRDFELDSDRLGISDASVIRDLSVMNNSTDTASIIRDGNGELVAVIPGITDVTLGDFDFTLV